MPTPRALALAAALLLPSVLPAQSTPNQPTPNLGPNVFLFTPATPTAEMQSTIDRVYAEQQHSEFGTGRYSFLFAPGTYHLRIPVGFYTEVAGLGHSPDDTRILGDLRVDAASANHNATTTFWRSAENLSVSPDSGTMQWAVSQAVSLRRMHIHGDLILNEQHGWASGGWLSDSVVDGTVNSGTQQQWISRNTDWKQWTGSNWNMVFVGAENAPAGSWPDPPFTEVPTVPVLREKPFPELAANHALSVRVPALTHNTSGPTYSRNPSGRTVPLARFYIAHPETDSARTMNRALDQGKDLLLTPGLYALTEPLRVTRKDTVVLGLGFATLRPTHGTEAITVGDVDGVSIADLLLDAGEQNSPSLLRVGTPGAHRSHAADPIALFNIFVRIGGAGPASTDAGIVIHSDDTLIDHTWIWRADHGRGAGWTTNPSKNGLVVNGNRVTAYGLFVEHHQQYQVLWNGEDGQTFFYQSEIPYDPPTQAAWSTPSGTKGWASYKVADIVHHHQAFGLGIYSVFRHPDVVLAHAIEVPTTPGVQFTDIITVALDNLGAIEHVINDTGESTETKPRHTPKLTHYP